MRIAPLVGKIKAFKPKRQLPYKAAMVGVLIAAVGLSLMLRSFAATSPSACDLNSDGIVNLTDLSILLSNFGKAGPKGDIDGNGTVNLTDLSMLLSNYGKTVSVTPPPTTPPPTTPPPTTPPPTTPPVDPPFNLAARTGGDNIVLLWDMPTTGIKSVQVFRNNTQIATVNVGGGMLKSDRQATRYIDKSVTRGTTYSYQVKAVSSTDTVSALSQAISVTHPASIKTPIPKVNIYTGATADQSTKMQDYYIPELQTWYPKVADSLAAGGYTVYTGEITLRVDQTQTGGCAGYVGGGLPAGHIMINAACFDDMSEGQEGFIVHESTHIIQGYTGDTTNWVTESVADWPREWFMRERYKVYQPSTTTQLTTGYSEGSYMLQWTAVKYNWPTLVRELNIAMRNGTYSASFFTNKTGKTPEQLYAEMKSQYYVGIGTIKASGGKCVDIPSALPDNNLILQLYTCNNNVAQKWALRYNSVDIEQVAKSGTKPTVFRIVNGDVGDYEMCLTTPDVPVPGNVHNTYCYYPSDNQMWSVGSNGSLVNPATGKCLATTGTTQDDGNKLITATCDGSAGQRWTTP